MKNSADQKIRCVKTDKEAQMAASPPRAWDQTDVNLHWLQTGSGLSEASGYGVPCTIKASGYGVPCTSYPIRSRRKKYAIHAYTHGPVTGSGPRAVRLPIG